MLLWLAIVLAVGWVVAFAVYHVTFAAIHVVLGIAILLGIVYFATPDPET
jgi:hypothetical protein